MVPNFNTSSDQASPPPVGILLANTGTPDAPTPNALRKFLREFLSDPHVVKLPRWLWLPILYTIILAVRPPRSARVYRQIWTEDGSPLLEIAQRQAHKLHAYLAEHSSTPMEVAVGMRYGNPSIPDALQYLKERGVRRFLIFPLFPQYSSTTTGSIVDAIQAVFAGMDGPHELRVVPNYHDHPAYIQALKNCVQQHWVANGNGARLLFSYHGIPQSYIKTGDPYAEQCHSTSSLLAKALGLKSDTWQVAFQSRFGPQKWLEPYTDETLKDWGQKGIQKVQVLCPGFSADCLETLYEIRNEARKCFLHAGGKDFEYIPALNDHPDHIQALANIASSSIQDWIEPSHTEHGNQILAEFDTRIKFASMS